MVRGFLSLCGSGPPAWLRPEGGEAVRMIINGGQGRESGTER